MLLTLIEKISFHHHKGVELVCILICRLETLNEPCHIVVSLLFIQSSRKLSILRGLYIHFFWKGRKTYFHFGQCYRLVRHMLNW
jgi:hypothetical protein